tara:strand:- start:264 stop:2693 length:2430 start_codon:yes stop_codon:yes gene_type:complete
MPNRNHLRIIADKQLEESGAVRFNYGFGDIENENDREPDYFFMAQGFRENLNKYRNDLEAKIAVKDQNIEVPYDIDYIEIDFLGQFNIEKFYTIWFNTFGLEGVSFRKFNRTGLFSISDREKFHVFISSIEALIEKGIDGNNDAQYSNNILYIKNFKLLTLNDVLKVSVDSLGNVVTLKTIELPASTEVENSIIAALEGYFDDNAISYIIDREGNRIELYDVTIEQLIIIASNFDVIESITSTLSSIVRPGTFNVVERDYGFEIVNSGEDLPLIGIVDTGISMQTPLAAITLQDETFTLDGNPLIDTCDRDGHGTMVGALAALGKSNHLNGFDGEVNADAKLLSIKLFGNGNGYLSEKKIIDMLYRAKATYPNLSIFVLTICFNNPKKTNEAFSNYTYELDKFAHKTDSLVFISTGNNNNSKNENTDYDLGYFNNEHTNLSTPADSMNNITIGAAADGLYDGVFQGISMGKEFPAIYSRKDHVDLEALTPASKPNKNLFKPDVLESGGDYGFYSPGIIDHMDNAAMSVLSANPAFGYTKQVGTSLSAPLAANLAAKLKFAYPDLKSQTLKALIINGASNKNILFPDPHKPLLTRTSGYGLIDIEQTIFSNENGATLILEDKIQSGEQKIYPINFPDYLISTHLGKTNRILKITGTLCFSFLPLQHNQLTYCPVHIAFSIFRNHSSDDINRVQREINSRLRTNLTWSQSARDKSKPAPYSNVQKIEFNVDVAQLRNENKTFKLAVQSVLSKQIMASQSEGYPDYYEFSLVLKIEETIRNSTGRLYDELLALNNVEVITNVEAEADLEGEA